MNKIWLPAILLLYSFFAVSPAAAATAKKSEPFNRFYAEFQNAVKADDKEKVADLTDFDGFTWEETESLRQIKTREGFLKNYAGMFNATIKGKIATAKPVKVGDGSYFIIWHTKSLEYSLYFARMSDGSYRFEGLTIGPY